MNCKIMKTLSALIVVLLLISITSCGPKEHTHTFDEITQRCTECEEINNKVVAYIGDSFDTAEARFLSLQAAVNFIPSKTTSVKSFNNTNTIYGYGNTIESSGITVDGKEVAFDFTYSTVLFNSYGITIKGNGTVRITGKELATTKNSIVIINMEQGKLETGIDFIGPVYVSDKAFLEIKSGKVALSSFETDYSSEKPLIKIGKEATVVVPSEEISKSIFQYLSNDSKEPEINNHNHSFTQKETAERYIIKKATCTESGICYKSCKCGAIGEETFEIDALGHNFTNYISDSNATHFSDGTKTAKCDRCEETDTKTDLGSKTTEHTFRNTVDDKFLKNEASCTSPAVYYKSCDCGEISDSEIFFSGEKTAHSYEIEAVNEQYIKDAPNCTDKGSYYKSCICGAAGTETFEVDALGHSFTNYTSDSNATHSADGTKTAKCDRCEETDTKTDEGSKTNAHSFSDTVKPEFLKSSATCTEPAVYYKSCECGEISHDTFENGEPLEHLWKTPVYNWTEKENGFICTATCVCSRDNLHTASENAKITYTQTKAPTHKEQGSGLYSATFVNKVFENQTKNINLAVVPHIFNLETEDSKFLKTAANCQHKAVYYKSCECGEHNEDTFEGNNYGPHSFEDGSCSHCGKTCSIKEQIIATSQTKTSYKVGDVFDSTGLVLKIVKEDDTEVYVSSGFEIETGEFHSVGNQEVVITYVINGEKLYFIQTVTVEQRTPKSLTVKTKPNKTTYFEYESFSPMGLVLLVTYDNNSTKEITDSFEYEVPQHGNGDVEITFSYLENNKTVTCKTTVSFVAVVPESIEILTQPDKVEYIVGDYFDPTGIVVRITNNDNSQSVIASGLSYPVSAFSTVAEAYNVTVSYTKAGKTVYTSLPVKVIPRIPVSLSVYAKTSKLSYKHGESCSSIYLLVTYNNGSSKMIDSNYLVDKNGPFIDETGLIELTFSYTENQTTVFCKHNVTVSHASLTYSCAITPTCTTDGRMMNWYCPGCEKYYSDEDCTNEIDSIVITKLGHDIHHEDAKAPTCTEHGWTEHEYCSRCDYSTKDKVTRLGHSFKYETNICTRCSANKYQDYLYITADGVLCSSENTTKITGALTIPDNATSISKNALKGCKKITKLIIPSSVTNIEAGAFSDLEQLTEIILPYCTEFIGKLFGATTYSYNDIYVPKSLERIEITGGTTIGDYAFRSCNSLKEVIIPKSVTYCGTSILQNCNNIEKLQIPLCLNYLGAYFGTNNVADSSGSAIPSTLKTVIVTGGTKVPADAFCFCRNIETVVLPDTITSIETGAFYGCSSLLNVNMPENLKSIEVSAFRACQKLKKIVLPDTVESVANSAFYYCSALEEITLPLGLKIINEGVFQLCTSLKSINIPENVKTIGSNAFCNCSALCAVSIPNVIENIEASAFESCSSLESINIGESVLLIGDKAFNGCTNIKKFVASGNSSTVLGLNCLSGCSKIEELTLPYIPDYVGKLFGATSYKDNYTYVPSTLTSMTVTHQASLDSNAFYNCNYITKVTINNFDGYFPNVKELIITGGDKIKTGSFNQKYNIEKITLPETIVEIESNTFTNAAKLHTIKLPEGLKVIGDSAFEGCTALKNIELPNSLETIGNKAFNKCSNIDVEMPESLISVGNQAFFKCSSMTDASFSENLISIGEEAFRLCQNLKTVYLPKSLSSLGARAFNWCTSLSQIEADSENPYYKTKNNTIFDKTGTTLIASPCAEGSVTIASDVIKISNHAFGGCTGLTSIIIPNTVTDYGQMIFYDCSNISAVTLPYCPNTLESLFNNFEVPETLKTVTITGGTTIPAEAFKNNNKNKLTTLILPDTITTIPKGAINGCSELTTIVIPAGVTELPSDFFYYTKKLVNIYFKSYRSSGPTSPTNWSAPESVNILYNGEWTL